MWRPATEMKLPSGALMAGKNGGVVAVSCRSAGNCSAGAAYVDADEPLPGLVVNEVVERMASRPEDHAAHRRRLGRYRRRRLRARLSPDWSLHRDRQLLEDRDDLRGFHRHHVLIRDEKASDSTPISAPASARSRCPATGDSTARCRGPPRPTGT